MSHFDQIKRILSQAGVEYEVVPKADRKTHLWVRDQPDGSKWIGDSGFSFWFEFDDTGNLSRVGSREG